MFQDPWEVRSNEILILKHQMLFFSFGHLVIFFPLIWNELGSVIIRPVTTLMTHLQCRAEVILWTNDLVFTQRIWLGPHLFPAGKSWALVVCLPRALPGKVGKSRAALSHESGHSNLASKWSKLNSYATGVYLPAVPINYPNQIPCIIARFRNCKMGIFFSRGTLETRCKHLKNTELNSKLKGNFLVLMAVLM